MYSNRIVYVVSEFLAIIEEKDSNGFLLGRTWAKVDYDRIWTIRESLNIARYKEQMDHGISAILVVFCKGFTAREQHRYSEGRHRPSKDLENNCCCPWIQGHGRVALTNFFSAFVIPIRRCPSKDSPIRSYCHLQAREQLPCSLGKNLCLYQIFYDLKITSANDVYLAIWEHFFFYSFDEIERFRSIPRENLV